MLANPRQQIDLDRLEGVKAHGQMRHRPGQMNKTEARYAAHLEIRVRLGQVVRYWFEVIKLRLAEKTFYTPDFLVLRPNGLIECHEVKGFWEDDARVKIKVAAETFPFTFIAAKPHGDSWEYEQF